MGSAPLIHIGYHKTGTTWLQRQVFSEASFGFHQVWPPAVVEAAFVNVNPFAYDPADVRQTFSPVASEAEQQGLRFVISHERLSGQPLQGGLDAREIAERMHEAYPEAKVLIVIRRQDSMLLSVYKQITTRGLNRDNFEQFVAHRVIEGRGAPVISFLRYHHLIGHYRKLFGAENVLVLAYEGLSDPRKFMDQISSFANTPAVADIPESKENVGLPTSSIAMLRYLNIAARAVGIDRYLVGPRAKPKMVNARLKVIRRLGGLAPSGSSKRIEERWRSIVGTSLRGAFAESNSRTAELTGLDLGTLGYETS